MKKESKVIPKKARSRIENCTPDCQCEECKAFRRGIAEGRKQAVREAIEVIDKAIEELNTRIANGGVVAQCEKKAVEELKQAIDKIGVYMTEPKGKGDR